MLTQEQINNLITGREMAAELPASKEGLRRFLETRTYERDEKGKFRDTNKFVKRSKRETLFFRVGIYELPAAYCENYEDVESEEVLTFSRDLGYIQGITALEAALKDWLPDLSKLVPGHQLDLPSLSLGYPWENEILQIYTEERFELLRDYFDLVLLEDFEDPENEDGHLTYSILGKTFARDGSGGEYILLKDGTVGYWGSEGQCGRLAESLSDCFDLIVNCPWWMDVANACNYGDPFESDEALQALINDLREEYGHIETEMQEQAAEALDMELEEDLVSLLRKFYDCATREPRLYTTYREDDGSTHDSSGSLFEYE